jgi:hypothetical protein
LWNGFTAPERDGLRREDAWLGHLPEGMAKTTCSGETAEKINHKKAQNLAIVCQGRWRKKAEDKKLPRQC